MELQSQLKQGCIYQLADATAWVPGLNSTKAKAIVEYDNG